MLPRALPLLVLSSLFLACAGTQSSQVSSDASPWLSPSPSLRQEIERQAQRLPWTHGIDRVEIIHWFATVGEPAYPTLLAMAEDPRADVAGAALAALGATGDARLVTPLQALHRRSTEQPTLALEHARTLMRLGDWSSAELLIEGLRSERLLIRALSIQTLFEATNERFEYDASAEPELREASILRWEAWWSRFHRDPLR